ncbi:MAG TPA: energy-coupling factor transporter transmembrane component T [Phycisphaeraceae bacterium]
MEPVRFLYQFSAGDSFLHRLDPRAKMVLIGCLLVATFTFPHAWVMPLVPIALLWLLGRIGPWQYAGFLLFLVPLMLAIVLIQLLSRGGPYIELLDLIPVSQPGLQIGAVVALRLAAMGIAFVMFSMTTDPFDWGLALYRSGLPYRVAFMFAFAMRFFPLLQEELATIRNALAARGTEIFTIGRPLRFLRGVAISIMPLGIGALRRSQDIALAMELRGFGYAEEAGLPRTLFRDVRLRGVDYAVMVASLAALAGAFTYAARQGGLPTLTTGQKVFGGLLLLLFSLVATVIARALRGERRQAADAQPPGTCRHPDRPGGRLCPGERTADPEAPG